MQLEAIVSHPEMDASMASEVFSRCSHPNLALSSQRPRVSEGATKNPEVFPQVVGGGSELKKAIATKRLDALGVGRTTLVEGEQEPFPEEWAQLAQLAQLPVRTGDSFR